MANATIRLCIETTLKVHVKPLMLTRDLLLGRALRPPMYAKKKKQIIKTTIIYLNIMRTKILVIIP